MMRSFSSGCARLLLAMCVAAASGCSTEFGGLGYNDLAGMPTFDKFSQGDLSFRMAGDLNAVLGVIRDYLATKNMPSVLVMQPPRTLVVTSYLAEPHDANARRIYRTAFRITLSEDNGKAQPACTYVSVSSLTQSQGLREEAWTLEEQPFDSSFWPGLQKLIEKSRCGGS